MKNQRHIESDRQVDNLLTADREALRKAYHPEASSDRLMGMLAATGTAGSVGSGLAAAKGGASKGFLSSLTGKVSIIVAATGLTVGTLVLIENDHPLPNPQIVQEAENNSPALQFNQSVPAVAEEPLPQESIDSAPSDVRMVAPTKEEAPRVMTTSEPKEEPTIVNEPAQETIPPSPNPTRTYSRDTSVHGKLTIGSGSTTP